MWCSRRGSGTIRVSLDIIVLESLIGLALASPIRREPEGVVLVARVALAIEAYVGGKAAEHVYLQAALQLDKLESCMADTTLSTLRRAVLSKIVLSSRLRASSGCRHALPILK